MVMLKLGCKNPKKREWIELPNTYKEKIYNGFKVVDINKLLWKKIQNIFRIQKKGYDAPILISGDRRKGKSTIAKILAYLQNPNLTIKNFVKGLNDSARAIDEAKYEDVLIFDEATLSFNSRDAMKKANSTLLKIIDVCGQKKLCLIFCIPSYFDLNRAIAIRHSLFLLHVYTDKNLTRGFFAYFGTKSKKILYERGKKNYGSMSGAKANFTGRFYDFKLDFENEYEKLKRDSLKEALGLKNNYELNREQRRIFILKVLNTYEGLDFELTSTQLGQLFDVSSRQINYYRRELRENEEKEGGI